MKPSTNASWAVMAGVADCHPTADPGVKTDTRWSCILAAQGDTHMQQTYTAVVKRSGVWWIGWIEEVPASTARGRPERNSWRRLE
jgi:hypothetical protein